MNIVKMYKVNEIPSDSILILSEGKNALDAWRNLSQFSKKVEKAYHLAKNEYVFVFKKNKYIDSVDRNKILDVVMDLVLSDEVIDVSKEDRDELEDRVMGWLRKILGDSYSIGGLIGYVCAEF